MLQGRESLYAILRDIFYEPLNMAEIELLKNNDLLIQLSSFSAGAKELLDGLHQEAKDDQGVQWLLQEYQQLFVGPGVVLAPIWESVYFDPERLLFGERTMAVRACYKNHNLQFILKDQQPDDHLAIELDFMGYLIRQELTSTDAGEKQEWIEEQKVFLQQHLCTWSDLFAKNVLIHSQSHVYCGAVTLLMEFLAYEIDELDGLDKGEGKRVND